MADHVRAVTVVEVRLLCTEMAPRLARLDKGKYDNAGQVKLLFDKALTDAADLLSELQEAEQRYGVIGSVK